MQGERYAFIHTRMTDPSVTAPCDHLVETFQPAQPGTPVQCDKCRVYHLADGGIPPNVHIAGHGFEEVHAACRDNRDLHCAGIDVDDTNAFLPSPMESPHADREGRGRLQAEVLAGDLPVLRGCIRIE